MRKPQCFYNDFTEPASKLSVGLTSAALLLGFNLAKLAKTFAFDNLQAAGRDRPDRGLVLNTGAWEAETTARLV